MKSASFGHRDFLVGAGVLLATGASLMHGPSARAEAVVQDGANEWRRRLAELDAGYPPILFGNLPTGDKKKGAHAVVAYGETNSGYPITHYGWSGYTNIILSGASIGSNARFRLT